MVLLVAVKRISSTLKTVKGVGATTLLKAVPVSLNTDKSPSPSQLPLPHVQPLILIVERRDRRKVRTVDISNKKVQRQVDWCVERISQHAGSVGRHLLDQWQATSIRVDDRLVVKVLRIGCRGRAHKVLCVSRCPLRKSIPVFMHCYAIGIERDFDAGRTAYPI